MIADDPCGKHLTKQQSKQKVTQPAMMTNVSVVSKALFSRFSVHKLQKISKFVTWNSDLALKAAITSRCDVTNVILTSA